MKKNPTIAWKDKSEGHCVIEADSDRVAIAINNKHFGGKNTARAASAFLVRVLATSKEWPQWSVEEIASRAQRHDVDFFISLGRALYEGAKPPFSPTEMFLLTYWDKSRFPAQNIPPLKRFTAEALRGLIQIRFGEAPDQGIRKTFERLGLRQEKPFLVRRCTERKGGQIAFDLVDKPDKKTSRTVHQPSR